jgi:hypothetical protein
MVGKYMLLYVCDDYAVIGWFTEHKQLRQYKIYAEKN